MIFNLYKVLNKTGRDIGNKERMVLEIKGLKIPSSKNEITNLDQRVAEHLDHLGIVGVKETKQVLLLIIENIISNFA